MLRRRMPRIYPELAVNVGKSPAYETRHRQSPLLAASIARSIHSTGGVPRAPEGVTYTRQLNA